MSTLLLFLPQRSRLRAQGRGAPLAEARSDAGREYDYVLSADGRHVQSQGRASAALLPRADTVLALPAEADLSWQSLTLPRVPRGKLRAALAGLLRNNCSTTPSSCTSPCSPKPSRASAAGWPWRTAPGCRSC